MSARRPVACRLLAVGMAAAALLGGLSSGQADAAVNTSRAHLVVYDDNIENMLPRKDCKDGHDFAKLIAFMKKQPKSPDVFAVQQISNQAQLNQLTRKLSDELPGTYSGVIALSDPGRMGYKSDCGKRKDQQTNAVIYRIGRLTFEDKATWRSDALQSGSCKNLIKTVDGSQDRVHNVAVRFRDVVTNRQLTVASIHWPTGKWDGPECAAENIKEANAAVDGLGGTLRIVTGDANATTGRAGWWARARGHGFRDPMAEQCGGRVCSAAYDTSGGHRIDFLLVKGGHGFDRVNTISASEAGGSYSDHLALSAYVRY